MTCTHTGQAPDSFGCGARTRGLKEHLTTGEGRWLSPTVGSNPNLSGGCLAGRGRDETLEDDAQDVGSNPTGFRSHSTALTEH